MRFATLNVSGPSTLRANRLLDFIPQLDADVLVLTETRENEGTRLLLDTLRQAGHAVYAAPTMRTSERGVALVQLTTPAVVSSRECAMGDLAHRLLVTEIAAEEPITVIGAYVPSRDTSPAKIERKQRFLRGMTRLVRSMDGGNVVFMGDLNIISRQHLPRFSAFKSWEYDALEDIESTGFVDAFAALYPEQQAHSWIGRKGAGYRYDYAFVSPSLASRVVDCEYLHQPREMGLTDHAAVVLTLDMPTVRSGEHVRELVAV